jgi:hypothetical protein
VADYDLAIIGGGMGGCAAALAATDAGLRVVMTESTRWIGGQCTSQATPPDENPWIATYGSTASYRRFRALARQYYLEHYDLKPAARANPQLNPGGGFVSHLCIQPRAALHALNQMLGPAQTSGQLTILLEHDPVVVKTRGDHVLAVALLDRIGNKSITVEAPMFIDATEGGDLLALADVEHLVGSESQRDTGEPHAPPEADPRNIQASTWVMAVGWDPGPGANHVQPPPQDDAFWRSFRPRLNPPWPGLLLDWSASDPVTLTPRRYSLFENTAGVMPMFNYRKVVDASICNAPPPHEVTLLNWPQNDYLLRDVVTADDDQQLARREARQLTLSLLHWLQTQAPRPDGGAGYPGLYPMPQITGTDDGLAMAPYIREARRIRARLTVTEQHVGLAARQRRDGAVPVAEPFHDSVGIGAYRIDLHPTIAGENYLDLSSLPFQIPLRACVPIRVRNLLPACKNIGTTHITNGCYRLHPVEWNIGEAVGSLAAFCQHWRTEPAEVCEKPVLLGDFQRELTDRGVILSWGPCRPL